MKFCETCKEEFDTKENTCPVCGGDLKESVIEDEDISTTVAIMTTLGIL